MSGGKDSTALLLLALERKTENLQAVFADTGHEHALTYEYVRYLNDEVFPIRTIRADFTADIERKRRWVQEKWPEHGISAEKVDRALAVLKPTGNPFLDLCIMKGRFPSTKARFCSEELKRNPIIEQVQMPLLDAGGEVWSWQGVRADESESRAKLHEMEEVGGGLWVYRPILRWTAQDCFEMHRKNRVKHNPLYEMGMGRVGCMPCIHARKDELLEIARRFPEEVERVAEWERLVADASKRDRATFFPSHALAGPAQTSDGSQITLDKHGVWQAVEWSKTGRGGFQYDIERSLDGPACSSIYGLCE